MIEALQFGNGLTAIGLAAATSGTLALPTLLNGEPARWIYVATAVSPSVRVRPFTGAAPADGQLILIPNHAPQIIYTGGVASLRFRNDDAAALATISIVALENQ